MYTYLGPVHSQSLYNSSQPSDAGLDSSVPPLTGTSEVELVLEPDIQETLADDAGTAASTEVSNHNTIKMIYSDPLNVAFFLAL